YSLLAAAGEIERDPAQAEVVDRLSHLEARIAEHRLARKSSSLGWLFGARERTQERLRGLYIYGDVGRGKTMLMDLFFGASDVVRLSARTDFRLEKLAGRPVWHTGDTADARLDEALDDTWRRLTGGHAGSAHDLMVKGRTLRVPNAAMGVARFSFRDLCEQPL